MDFFDRHHAGIRLKSHSSPHKPVPDQSNHKKNPQRQWQPAGKFQTEDGWRRQKNFTALHHFLQAVSFSQESSLFKI
jgi:hypothetical protein